MHNPKEIYKAGSGWVRQFEDGTILGPFETRDGAMYAKKDEKKVEKTEEKKIEKKNEYVNVEKI